MEYENSIQKSSHKKKTVSFSQLDSITLQLDPEDSDAPTFEGKTWDLYEPIKIGRQVNSKTKPSPSNGFFDSKVLSRNHAEIWVESGKVLIKDTKSSNGTYLNNKRLGEEGTESEPMEIFNGDTIQFGIDIEGEDGKLLYRKVCGKVKLIHPSGGHSSEHIASAAPILDTVDFENIRKILQEDLERGNHNHKLENLKRAIHDISHLPEEIQKFPDSNEIKHLKNRMRTHMDKVESLTALLNKLQEENDALRRDTGSQVLATDHTSTLQRPVVNVSSSPSGSQTLNEKVSYLEQRLHQLQIDYTTLTDTHQHLLQTNRDLETQVEAKQALLLKETEQLKASHLELAAFEKKLKQCKENAEKQEAPFVCSVCHKAEAQKGGWSWFWFGGLMVLLIGYFTLFLQEPQHV